MTDPSMLLADAGDDIYISDVYDFKRKSPKRAFLQSLLIPGWGQWYAGSRWKPFLFVGLEAGGWLGWSNFRSKGNDIQDEFRMFANQMDVDLGRPFWDYGTYIDSLSVKFYDGAPIESDHEPYPNPDLDPQAPAELVFSHHIPLDADGIPVKNDEYYENIGKYDQFQYGWNDYSDTYLAIDPDSGDPTVHLPADSISPNRFHYVTRREDANNEFDKATKLVIGVIANHLVSAFEAALGARNYNRKQDQFGDVGMHVRFVNVGEDAKLTPKFYVNYRF